MKDMNENTLWATFWAFVAIVLIVITAAVFSYNVIIESNISKAIKNGADPIKAMCAYKVNPVICLPEVLK